MYCDTAVEMRTNQGLCSALNAGLSAVHGNVKYVCVHENDHIFPLDTIPAMVKVLAACKDVGMIFPCLEDRHEKYYSKWEKDDRGLLIMPEYAVGVSAWKSHLPTGPCICYRRSDLLRIGGFDRFMFNGWQESDMGRNFQYLGLKAAAITDHDGHGIDEYSIINKKELYTNDKILRWVMGMLYFLLKHG